jgi:hypothetical protein
MRARRQWVIMTVVVLWLLGWAAAATAHRSGCHRWHSCPSDHDTYTCGDLGYCSQCPDNEYCQAGKPKATTKPPVKPDTPTPAPSHRPRT